MRPCDPPVIGAALPQHLPPGALFEKIKRHLPEAFFSGVPEDPAGEQAELDIPRQAGKRMVRNALRVQAAGQIAIAIAESGQGIQPLWDPREDIFLPEQERRLPKAAPGIGNGVGESGLAGVEAPMLYKAVLLYPPRVKPERLAHGFLHRGVLQNLVCDEHAPNRAGTTYILPLEGIPAGWYVLQYEEGGRRLSLSVYEL